MSATHLTRSGDTWVALTSLLFRKPTHLTRASLSHFSEGALTNLMGADSMVLLEVFQFLAFFFAMPLQFALSVALLASLLGWVFLPGLAALVVNMLMIERLGNSIKRAQLARNTIGDRRTLLINEALQGARTVKLYAWEDVMMRRVSVERRLELIELRRIAMLRAVQQFLSFGFPTICQVAVFVLYEHVHSELRPSRIFAAMAAFEYLNMSLVVIPNLLNEVGSRAPSQQRSSAAAPSAARVAATAWHAI